MTGSLSPLRRIQQIKLMAERGREGRVEGREEGGEGEV